MEFSTKFSTGYRQTNRKLLATTSKPDSHRPVKPRKPEAQAKSISRQRSPLQPFVLLPKVFFTRYEPTWKAILTYTALVYYSNTSEGSCEGVTMKTMAKRTGIGRRTFLRGLEELQKKGIVKVTHRSGKSEKGGRIPLANLYEIADLQPDASEPI
jgi:hypothetical protein